MLTAIPINHQETMLKTALQFSMLCKHWSCFYANPIKQNHGQKELFYSL